VRPDRNPAQGREAETEGTGNLAAAIIRSWLTADTVAAARSFRLLPIHIQSLTNELRQDALVDRI
jgi:hypothetical protein